MNNSPASSASPTSNPKILTTTFQDLRSSFLKKILIITSIIGFFIVINDLTSAATPYIAVVLVGYTVLLVTAVAPIPYPFKSGILLGLFFLLGIYSLLGTGIYGFAPLYFLAFTLLAAFLFDWKVYLASLALSLAAIAVLGWSLITGRISLSSTDVMVGYDTTWMMIAGAMAVISIVLEEGWRQLSKEFIVSQSTLKNAMNTLAIERASLENRIKERTSELTLSADSANSRAERLRAITDIMANVTSIQDIDQLLPEICRLIGEHFGLYHVGIYINDNREQFTALQAAYGSGGERLVSRGYKIKIGQAGIIGTVAARGEPHVAEKTKEDLAYNVNPELPDTRSLIAMPLIVNKRLVGVLDLQSNVEQGLVAKDLDILLALANQVAVAIENTRISNETRRALAEARVVYGQYMRQAWEQYSEEKQKVGYRFDSTKLKPIESPLNTPEITSAMETGEAIIPPDGKTALAIPLKLRDQVIGVLDVRPNNPDRQWTENELGLVQAIAERVSLALENARLFEETTRRADRERAVSEITNRIRSTNDPQVMLQTALDELKRALGARDVKIRPYSPAATEQKAE